MKRPARKTLLLTVGVAFIIMLIAGCEEEQKVEDTPTTTKMSRIVAVQNAELRKEIKRLKQQHQKELDRQNQLLDKCLRERKTAETLATKGMQKELMDDILGSVSDENKKLREENGRLKEQIAQLEAQVQLLKKELDECGEKLSRPDKPQPL